ncbi:MAG: hypothetical protein CMP10_11980 [Zetaproteobacteria bacterium]|nr:hypothetical protein [Pseudobdellovibrionaceae bacterium]
MSCWDSLIKSQIESKTKGLPSLWGGNLIYQINTIPHRMNRKSYNHLNILKKNTINPEVHSAQSFCVFLINFFENLPIRNN